MRIHVAAAVAALAVSGPAALAEPPAQPAAAAMAGAGAVLAYYPKAALAAGVSGTVRLKCRWGADSNSEHCLLESEEPTGAGFGAAALALAASALPYAHTKKPGEAPVILRFRASPPAILPDMFHPLRGGIHFVRSPTQAEMFAAFPRAAAQLHISGEAMLNCIVGADGGLQDCLVVREAPVGHGFGDAALAVTLDFRVAERTSAGEPTEGAALSLPFIFEAPATASTVLPPPPDPSLAFYPAAARAAGLDGEATLSCARNAHLALKDCTLVSERPAGQGFGAAALAMAARSPDNPKLDVTEAALTATAPIAVRFRAHPPSIDPDLTEMAHVVKRPQVVKRPSPATMALYYPARAADERVSGSVEIHCRVTRGGRLDDCAPVREAPTHQDFGAAALIVAEREYRMSPMLVDGQPSDDGEADLTIDFTAR